LPQRQRPLVGVAGATDQGHVASKRMALAIEAYATAKEVSVSEPMRHLIEAGLKRRPKA
jgi:hypothetical protein